MKTLKTFFAIGFLSLLTSCGSTQQTTNTNSDTSMTNGRRSNTNTSANSASTSVKTRPNNTTNTNPDSSVNPNRGSSNIDATKKANADRLRMEEQRRSSMYKTLVMDMDQVKRYETDYNTKMNSWKRSNPNKEMNSYERAEYNDKMLKPILSEQQFTKYQQWAIDNAEDN